MDLLISALLGIGLSMDCFAVSLAIGSTTRSRRIYAAANHCAVLWCVPDRYDGDRLGSRAILAQHHICFRSLDGLLPACDYRRENDVGRCTGGRGSGTSF